MSTVSFVLIILSALAIINLIIYFVFPKHKGKAAVVSRTFIGLVFIFSGFVKGVDPMGTMYKIEDYFIAYKTLWAIPLAIYISIFLCALEFVLGVFMVLKVKIKWVAWLVLITMIGFTIITFIDALYSPVPDCGCFGEALIISNIETFWKNIIILTFLLPCMLYLKKYKRTFNLKIEYLLLLTISVLFISFEIYNYRHLPVIDFMDWKVGNKLFVDNPQPLKFYLTYKNKETGEEKEYLSPNYPYNDSIWMTKWEFVKQRSEDPNPKQHNLFITDENEDNVTDNFIKNPDFQFMLIVNDMNKTNLLSLKNVEKLFNYVDSNQISFIGITSGLNEDIKAFTKKIGTSITFYNADDVVLKTMVRSNPGLVLIKNGVVIDKWHYNDFPTVIDIGKILSKK